MTTTKEDQIHTEFKSCDEATDWETWQACAESYEQKLAEKYAEITKLRSVPMKYKRMEFNAQLQKELSEANARNARLVEALDKYRGQINRFGTCTAGDAISANSEALAANKVKGE